MPFSLYDVPLRFDLPLLQRQQAAVNPEEEIVSEYFPLA
jgi:hypothetical protein